MDKKYTNTQKPPGQFFSYHQVGYIERLIESLRQCMTGTSSKEQIFNQALKHFANYGLRGARTREIAEAAGVNHALIKYYFKNKETLWRHSVDYLFERLDAAMASADLDSVDPDDPAERLRRLLTAYTRYCAEHPEHGRIIMQESTEDNERLRWIVEHHLNQTLQPLDALCHKLISKGDLPKMPVASFRYMLVGACQNLFILGPEAKLLYKMDPVDEATVQAHTAAVIRLFLR